jgi:lycopene cyclase domain-containing protein
MSLYLIVLILVMAGPFALSFEKNLKLYKRWKYLLPAICVTMILFISWDIVFTHIGCWVFNPKYISGIYFFKLPLEEYLFFIAIPYACTFTYYAIKFHFPQYNTGKMGTMIISIVLIIFSLIAAFFYAHHLYTFVSLIVLAFFLLASYLFAREVLKYYYAIFPVLVIPLLIVNGILTGTGIDQEVFSYHPMAIMGIKLLTVPLEDFFFGFSLILMTIGLTEVLERKHATE